MRFFAGFIAICTALAFLPGCSSFHQSFRSSFKTSFMKSCTEHAADNLCQCVETSLEKSNSDTDLMSMAATDEGLKKMADAARACAQPQTSSAPAEAAGDPGTIGLYVTPYYNSNGPSIHVGKYSSGLAAGGSQFVDTIHAMKQHWLQLRFYELYVGAIRLYDSGYRDEAVYWFYTAQYRGRQFGSLADPDKLGDMGAPGFELAHAADSFFQLAGPQVNGYAFGHFDMLFGVLRRVQRENTAVGNLRALYPGVAFVPQSQWNARNAAIDNGLGAMISQLRSQQDSIHARRVENGTEAHYAQLTSKPLPR